MTLAVTPLTADEPAIEALVELWEACGLLRPWNEPRADIRAALAAPSSDILVGRDGSNIIASVMVGFDGHRGAVYYLAVAPDRARQRIGRQMMKEAERWLE
ncbi:MAG: GNAT family N-acetyltransferase, partial [Pseudomonadota bacterium]